MPYSTQAQIVTACGGQTEFDQLFDLDGDGVADATAIDQAQTAADALINSYLWLRYQTVANPSPVLQMLAADEAVYHIRKYRPLGLTSDQNEQHKQRLEMLDKMRRGELRPDDPAPPSSSAGNKADFIENCSPMSRARSKGSIW